MQDITRGNDINLLGLLTCFANVFESVGPDYLAKKGLMLLWVSSPPQN
jgi:hypothetical protein